MKKENLPDNQRRVDDTKRPSATRKKKIRKKNKKNNIFKLVLVCLIVATIIVCGIKLSDEVVVEYQKYEYPIKDETYVDKYSKMYNVPRTVIYAVIDTESSFDPQCTSSAGACGLMQLMPDTFTWLTTKTGENVGVDKIYDVETNIKYGTYYLSYLYKNLGVWENVYAAYNAGLGRVQGWLSNPNYSKDGILTNIPIQETAEYVKKVKTAREKYMQLYNMGEISNGAETTEQ